MKLRRAASAAVAALALVLMLPGSSDAATGTFSYQAWDKKSETMKRFALTDPANDVTKPCHDIPESDDPDTEDYARAPHNETDMYAHIWSETGCVGDHTILKAHGTQEPDDPAFFFRSVYFSETI
ncbi:hypothetical protein [Streptomyces griseocarneus]|uniref:hypothetical protein n=1 Tax=Streptomyces griseocarneus TaxID=51201 RepID=UPI00167E832C|nr:hypothetical protein [Streptomyces griseocarneus]MBZ6473580.1 hypothetical protein [Streptomyces griseocarneus]GHG56226.1 hypothetical protein GCM10018779_20080 [Streptomyces griseocarneus]